MFRQVSPHQQKIPLTMHEGSLFLPTLSSVQSLEIHACFDAGVLSSGGRVLVLREIEWKPEFAEPLPKPRPIPHNQMKPVKHGE
jgi:hypothetical protein